jgi:hypothetical protein
MGRRVNTQNRLFKMIKLLASDDLISGKLLNKKQMTILAA